MRNWLIGGVGLLAVALTAPSAAAQDDEGGATGETRTLTSGDESSAAAASSAADGAASSRAKSDFNRELLTIEEDVNTLKERVFRAKATLQLLSEVVAQGSSSGSRATVIHVNKLGRKYQIDSVAYYLNGQGIFSKTSDAGSLDGKQEFKVYDVSVPPGNHTLTVNLAMRGNGYGVFSYMQAYQFTVQSTQEFSAEEGKSCQVRVIVDERHGLGLTFTERPGVTFETRCVGMDEATAAAPE